MAVHMCDGGILFRFPWRDGRVRVADRNREGHFRRREALLLFSGPDFRSLPSPRLSREITPSVARETPNSTVGNAAAEIESSVARWLKAFRPGRRCVRIFERQYYTCEMITGRITSLAMHTRALVHAPDARWRLHRFVLAAQVLNWPCWHIFVENKFDRMFPVIYVL